MSTENLLERVNTFFVTHKVKAQCISSVERGCFFILSVELVRDGKIKNVERLMPELQLHLKISTMPMVEISNGELKIIVKMKTEKVLLNDLVCERKKSKMSCDEAIMGRDLDGNIISLKLRDLPHALIAGTTGSGKSVFLHTIINSFLKVGSYVNLILCDPKQVEFEDYKGAANNTDISIDVHNDFASIIRCLNDLVNLMERRYTFLANHGCKSIMEYNSTHASNYDDNQFSHVVCIIDEFADLMLNDVDHIFENLICKLAAKSRAAGIHLIIATQRPSIKFVTGNIKANFPTRICFKVATGIDSRVILDQNGGEKLTGYGDGLYLHAGVMTRFQSAFATPEAFYS